MPKEPKEFTVADPATFDGDPFEVAARAVRQIGAVAGVLSWTIGAARNMVGNAEMERQIYATGEANIKEFDAGPQAKMLAKMADEAESIATLARILERAAGFDPKHPPKE